MSYYVVDVESDGPCPGRYSMVCFGAVKVTPELDQTFYGQTRPVTPDWLEEALAVSGFTREEHKLFDPPFEVMKRFYNWVRETNTNGRPIFVSDNPAYDWQWINYYFHNFYYREPDKTNPFGWSARRIGDLYCGLVKDSYARWKHLRRTTHDHNPVNDAKGNAEVLLHMRDEMGLKIGFK